MARRSLLVAALVVSTACSWGDERRAIRQRLTAFVDLVNAGASVGDGLPAAAHAARVAGFFTEDVEVNLGDGTAPITGREMLMAMALRLQPRTAAYRVAAEDVSVTLDPSGDAATVTLTAEFIRRDPGAARSTMDAREFALEMRLDEGAWKIAGVTAVPTLR
jgi:hypothetical protein